MVGTQSIQGWEVDPAKESVLVVDDNPDVLATMVGVFEHLGFPVEGCESAQTALQRLALKEYSLLITDLRLQHMDGLDLIRRARALYPYIVCIAVTGYTREYSYMDVIQAGATDFLRKPFDVEELHAKVIRGMVERERALELNRLSITDGLTGLYNRRFFYHTLEREIVRAGRQETSLSILLLDLDNFKAFNDRYGHLAGDRLLQKAALIIQALVRHGVDAAFRYGGDEFAAILVEAGADAAINVGRRIRQQLRDDCDVSASLGFATLADGMDAEALVLEADKELYRAKGTVLNSIVNV